MSAGYGDASACLMLRIPWFGATRPLSHQIACPHGSAKNRPESGDSAAAVLPGVRLV